MHIDYFQLKEIQALFHFESRTVIFLVILSILFCVAEGVSALGTAPDAPSTDTAAQGLRFLKKLEAKYKDTLTFYGEFHQKKISTLFLEEIDSRGQFWYQKPGRFRCEYLPPNQQVNLILDEVAYIYIPEIKQVEIYRFKPQDSPVKKLNQMLLGFGVSVKDVLEVYDVNAAPEEENDSTFVLQFNMKKKEEGLNFDKIKIWVDKEKLQPLRLVFIEPEPNKDETRIEIKNLEFNKKLKAQVFKPDFPRDAEVIEQN
ncbi:outer membrane lipoprotein carrier protein LolA [Candidatus Sumerlaeota bacterium]|nr:outer membrane lipoprotein carrier protein LolA [Candidatus Sumerlaeota bacterium]